MSIMGKMVRIPAGNTTNEHYNFVVAKPLVCHVKIERGNHWLEEISVPQFLLRLAFLKRLFFRFYSGVVTFHIKLLVL